jgi:hypothetical protein
MRVLVLDHESSDETAALTRERGAYVLTRAFDGFVNARRYALSQVRTPWTLMIDADERPDALLRAAILQADGSAEGYTVSRTTYYCGKPLRMWRGERLLRLFRTQSVQLEAAPAAGGDSHLHERWICAGRVEALSGTLEHYSYPDAQSYREKYERYTDIESRGVRAAAPAELALQTLLAPLRFVNLLARGAAFDGPGGWYVAWKSALYPTVVQWKALRRS